MQQFRDFLEKVPPGKWVEIIDFIDGWTDEDGDPHVTDQASLPTIQLHCDHESCGGIRSFEPEDRFISFETGVDDDDDIPFGNTGPKRVFVKYLCRNCKMKSKVYALELSRLTAESIHGRGRKYGEEPPFGPPLPSRVSKLIGPDRELFIKGRRAENLGLGIGAYAYYRQVVENQKGRIIGQIADVAAKMNVSEESIALIRAASNEQQFKKAMEMIGDAIPKALLHGDHNHLQLLHTALSKNLHSGSDEECLALASSIRVVLSKLAEKISEVINDEQEWKTAVNTLLNLNATKPTGADQS